MKSTKFTFEASDFFRSLIIAVLTPVFVIVQQSLAAGSFIFDWKSIGIAALGGFLAYLTKNFFTNDVPGAVKTLEKQGVSVRPMQQGPIDE